MKNLVVASAQQQMRLFDSPDSYRKELTRFLYMARAKGAELIVFPGLAGVMAAAPLVEGFRVNLLKQAEDEGNPSANDSGEALSKAILAILGDDALLYL